MTKKRIEDMREVVLPFLKKRLLKINYENLGESDAEEFAMDFNEILDLAIKALEQEPILDKIRAEMEQIKEAEYQIYGKGSWRFVDKCLDILDKYKGESEE